VQRRTASARHALGEEAFATAWAAGLLLERETAIAEALTQIRAIEVGAGALPVPDP